MPMFISFDHSLTFHGMSMHLNSGCPRIRLDRLIFPQMTHTLYFSESDDFRSKCVWKSEANPDVSSPTLIVRSTLQQVSRLPLGTFLTLLPGEDSLALSVAFPPGKGSRNAKLHSVDVSILGTVINTEIDIDQDLLSFTADAELYGNYPARLSVTAPTNVPWDRMTLTVNGEFNDTTVQIIDTYVQDYILEDIINSALEREENARQAVTRANQTLTMLTTQLQMREVELSEANENYQRAFEASQMANETLRNASLGVDTANTVISEAQNALNAVCREDNCMDVEVRREFCQTCYQDILTEEAGECIILRPKVPAPYFDDVVGFRRYRRWEYVELCEDVCYRVCGWFTSYTRCRRACRGVCVSNEYVEPIIGRVQKQVLEPVTVPCDPPMQVLQQSIPLSCCESYIERTPNVQCRERCRSAQVQATERLRQVSSEAAEPFERLNRARQAVLIANTRLARARIQRDSARLRRDQAREPYRNSQFATVLSLLNQQRILSEISDELKIARLYESMGIGEIFTLYSASFTTQISTQSPTTLPMLFLYSLFGRDHSKTIPFDLTASYELNLRQIAQEIAAEIVNTPSRMERRSTSTLRFKRQDGTGSEIVERSRNKENFQANCALITSIDQYIQNILSSLEVVGENIDAVTDRLQQSKESLQRQAESNSEEEVDQIINFDALEEHFNITHDDFRDDSDEQIIDDYKNYFKDLANTTGDILDTVENTSFGQWQVSMEMLHNQTGSAAGYPCVGFADCLDIVTSLIKRLITDLRPGADKQVLLQQLDQNRQRFIQLATSMNLTVQDAGSIATAMLDTVNADTLSTYWCSSAPNITDQPPMQVNISSGSDLTLECPYESSLPASAHWCKDGVPIPASNSSTLRVPDTNTIDSGNYTCHVTNAVGMESSLNVSVLVYELPAFFQILRPVTTYAGNESGAWFSCNASAWPYPGWRWYYRAHELDPWTQFEGEDTNELTVPSPQKENEGWYTCEAFNDHGYLRAPPVRLTVLPVSVAQLSLKIEFSLTANDISQKCTSIPSLRDSIDSYIREIIKTGSASIQDIDIDASTPTSFKIVLTLISDNITIEDTRNMVLRDIENMALPSRGDVINVRRALQQAAIDGEVVFTCQDAILLLQASSLTFKTLEYICPQGQELHSNFLLCGEPN